MNSNNRVIGITIKKKEFKLKMASQNVHFKGTNFNAFSLKDSKKKKRNLVAYKLNFFSLHNTAIIMINNSHLNALEWL